MAKGAFFGIAGKARKIKKMYIGIGGKARKVKKAYIGIGGKARLFYSSGVDSGLWVSDSERVKVNNAWTVAYRLGKVNLSSCELQAPVQMEAPYTSNQNGSATGQIVAGAEGKMYAFRGSTATIWEIDPATMAYLRDTKISTVVGYYGSSWARSMAGEGSTLYISNMCRGNMGWQSPMFFKYNALTGALLSQSGQDGRWIVGNGKPGQFVVGMEYENDDEYSETAMSIVDGNTFATLVSKIGGHLNNIGSAGSCCYSGGLYYMYTRWEPGPGVTRILDGTTFAVKATKSLANANIGMHGYTHVT